MNEKEKKTGPVKIYNAQDRIEAERIIDILKDENIIAFSKGSGSGEYMNIYQGFSVYGEDIYVDVSDVDRAKSIIGELETQIEQNQIHDISEEEVIHVPFYKNRTVLARIIIGYFVLMAIFIIYVNNFM